MLYQKHYMMLLGLLPISGLQFRCIVLQILPKEDKDNLPQLKKA